MSYNIGDIIKVKITGIVDFGAFATFNNCSGLIHWKEIPKAKHGEVSSFLSIGDELDAKIIDLKSPNKYSLSIAKAIKANLINEVKKDVSILNKEETSIRSIWKIFTEVNKYMLEFLKLPISLDGSTAILDQTKKRLTVNINPESKFQLFEKEVETLFNTNICENNKGNGYFISNVDDISEARRIEFEEDCTYYYIKFNPLPVIDGKIYNFRIEDKELIQNQLIEYFPNIIFISKNKFEFEFRQAYSKHFQAKEIYDLINDVLNEIKGGLILGNEEKNKPLIFDFQISTLTADRDKFFFEKNIAGQIENEETIIGALRGEEFYCKSICIGKLSKVDYPKLTFLVTNTEIDEVKTLVDNKEIDKITSDLSGATEKVNRLNESFSKITSQPEKLANPMLASYLFDATKATPIDKNLIEEREKIILNNQLNANLNPSQIEAIAKAVEAQDLALIQGPPGTGKSTAIAELIWQLVLADRKADILLTSEANLAVDNALDRLKYSIHNLVKPIRIGAGDKISVEGLPYAITEMKKWAGQSFNSIEEQDNQSIISSEEYASFDPQNVVLNQWMNNIYKRSKIQDENNRYLWFTYLNNLPIEVKTITYNQYIKNCNVIGATCSSISEQNYKASEDFDKQVDSRFFKKYKTIFPWKKNISFNTVVQDEASKATPAELSLPLIYGKKSVIIGDHRQLPPNLDKEDILYKLHLQGLNTQDQEEKDRISKLEKFVKHDFDELEKSHFERLYTQIDSSLKGTFRYQYRMHPDINEVIKQFYKQDGGLECGFIDKPYDDSGLEWYSRYHGINIDGLISPENHVIWVDVKSPEFIDGTSRANQGEVDAVQWILSSMAQSESFQQYNNQFSKDEDKEIGIISFYASQLKLLSQSVTSIGGNLSLKLSSVDRFQGMERNIILVSLVRSNRIAAQKNQSPDFRIYGEMGYPVQNDLGFARSPNRLNVALSRAKRLLIIVGNSDHYSSYKNKNGDAIYRNVYESIKDNPHGRILTWESEFEKKRPKPMSKNRSVNLNTRDIKESDIELRHISTWLNGTAETVLNPKIAVLELSTKAVKLLIGKNQNEIISMQNFNFDYFRREAQKTETGKGLDSQNLMDMQYFKNKVMPSIKRMKSILYEEGVNVLYSVATAAYRTAKNREDIINSIRNNLGINVRILSKKEESLATLFAYSISTSYKSELHSSPHVVMIDQGGGSTEISVFKQGQYISSQSINLGTTGLRNMLFKDSERDTSINDALRKSDQMIKERLNTFYKNMDIHMQSEVHSFCVSVGTAITKATNKKNNASQHDSILTQSYLMERIKVAESKIINQFSTVGDLNDFDFEAGQSNKQLDSEITIRLGLPMFISLMNRFDISEIHVSGTGLWYGIYLQQLFNVID